MKRLRRGRTARVTAQLLSVLLLIPYLFAGASVRQAAAQTSAVDIIVLDFNNHSGVGGSLLALQSKQFSTNLYLWRRTHAQLLRQAEQQLRYASLPLQGQSIDSDEQFQAISTWFACEP